jgi:hypothetical protein
VDIMTDDPDGQKERACKREFELAAMFYLEGVSVALMNELHIGPKNLEHVPPEWE